MKKTIESECGVIVRRSVDMESNICDQFMAKCLVQYLGLIQNSRLAVIQQPGLPFRVKFPYTRLR